MDAPVLYVVQAWVSPDGGDRYLDWLEQKHMAEVIREPGFLWARRVRLDQTDERGWRGYLLLYGLASREALAVHAASARARCTGRQATPRYPLRRLAYKQKTRLD